MSDFGGLFEGLRASTEQEIEARAAAYELKILARSQCSLCDNYGYLTNGLVCDHVDRRAIASTGVAKVRRALIKAQVRRNQPPATVTNIGDKA